ncbi:Xaa-Pro aminopeptidase [Candidatus Magnetomorum sp. HK-1]|nr:Xaa-Pro aminopeptidase [Candidatus Magnetomorum sp. HK-1]
MKKIEDKQLIEIFQSRIQNLQKTLACNNSDGALLTYSRDILYFTGTAQPSYLVVTPDEYHLYVKSGIKFVLNEIFIDPSKVAEERKLSNIYNRFFSKPSNKKIGIQLDVLTAKEYIIFKKIFGDIEFFDVSPMTLELRAIKDEHEIEQIKKACVCTQRGFEEACNILKPGISELELSAAVEYAHRLAGHEGDFFFRKNDFFMSMGPIGSGKNLKDPSGVLYSLTGKGQSASIPIGPSKKRIESGETIIIDIPCHINGYHCDHTRSFVAGHATSETRECYGVLKQISDYLIEEVIKPGISCAAIYQSAIDFSKDSKYSQAFLKLKAGEQSKLGGHGIGLELNEPPLIWAGNNQIVLENNIIAVELHMMDEKAGVLKLEDTIHVRKNKNDILTTSSRELFESGV